MLAARAAVMAMLGDGYIFLGHIGPCDRLPPPLLDRPTVECSKTDRLYEHLMQGKAPAMSHES